MPPRFGPISLNKFIIAKFILPWLRHGRLRYRPTVCEVSKRVFRLPLRLVSRGAVINELHALLVFAPYMPLLYSSHQSGREN